MTIPYIKKVSSIALGAIESVLAHWLPGGKKQGQEYVVKNPTRADAQPGSFSINLNIGEWSDFATGDKGKDLVSLVGYLERLPQGKAAERLAEYLNIPPEKKDSQKCTGNDSKESGNGNPINQSKRIKWR